MTMLTIHDLETPALLVDLDRMEGNIQRMQAHCDALGLAFRPHIKTHKIPEIARLQVEAGAQGIACQKVSEAEVFAQAGFNDIQIPYNIVGASKTARLAELALYNRVTVTADSLEVIEGLSQAASHDDMAIRVLIELETALKRTGAQPHEVVELAQRIEAAEHLHFAGIMAYPSDLSARPLVQEALHLLDRAGIGVDIVSGGGTGAALVAGEFPELTELRVGTYVFNDYTCVRRGWADLDDCALLVAATVVSLPGKDRAVLDSGSKTLTPEVFDGEYGYILEYPQARIYRLAEEHAFVDLTDCDERPAIGERVHVLPVHVCVAVNMHDAIYGVRGEVVETTWQVAARGRVW